MLSSSDSQELYAALTSEEGWIGTVSSESIALQTRARRLCQRYDSTDCADMEGAQPFFRSSLPQEVNPLSSRLFAATTALIFISKGLPFSIMASPFLIHPCNHWRSRHDCAGRRYCIRIPCARPAQREAGVSCAAPIHIGRNVWIGANATICKGVSIGENSVIGAGSVVTHDIPANVVAFGAPLSCSIAQLMRRTAKSLISLFNPLNSDRAAPITALP